MSRITFLAALLGLLVLVPHSAMAKSGGRCTNIFGKAVPCPAETTTVTSVTPTANHCTRLDGTPVPCPGESSNPAPIERSNSSGCATSPCPDDSGRGDMTTTSTPLGGAPSPSPCSDVHGARALPCPPDAAAVEPTTAARKIESRQDRRQVSPVHGVAQNIVADQKAIWTSPLRIRLNDVQWLAPLLGGAAVAVASDTDIERHLPSSPTIQKRSNSFSNYGLAAFGGLTGAAFLWGNVTHDDHMRETAMLSGESALDSLAVTYAIKSITQRDRPLEGNLHGTFWSHGDSFPSEHSAAAWSIASVVAHEYPGPLVDLLAYGGATAISASRVTARKHFASDVLVGGALGYFVGRQVYRAHRDQYKPDRAYGTFERSPRSENPRNPSDMGSVMVPLDSWIYPALNRLGAMGYIQSAFAGLRPWTRMECARLLAEAETNLPSVADSEALKLDQALQAEFAQESNRLHGGANLGFQVESIYTRLTGITGRPLNDSFHFGQTIINDFGRPYQEGFNAVTGFSARAEAGPLAFYVRGEYQHAPGAPPYSQNVREFIGTIDLTPVLPATPVATVGRLQLLDTYVALNIHDNQISCGRQSMWWGPGQGGAMMFSDNAAPVDMLRWTRVTPMTLPGIFRRLGPMRTDVFIGRLEGHHYPGNPYITGQKVNFKPTPNLEFGFSKMTVFAGGGVPLTWHNFYKANFSVGSHLGAGSDPGDRRGGFDFTYRVPHLRKWLAVYSDSLADDDPSPLASPRRAAINPGIYLTKIPGIPKLDFHAEAAYTDVRVAQAQIGEYFYWNGNFRDSHTNDGNIMGSWVGREGKGIQAWLTYWLSPQNTIRLGYRNGRIAKDFVTGGASLNDFYVRGTLALRPNCSLDSFLQYERWNLPLLSTSLQSNVTTWIQMTYRPKWKFGRD